MHNRVKKVIQVSLFVVGLLCGMGFFTAEGRASELPSGLIIGDNNGIFATQEGEYFLDVKNMDPGKQVHKQITLRNTEEDNPFQLELRTTDIEDTGKVNLSEYIMAQFLLDDVQIFKGILSETSSFAEKGFELGTYSSGKDHILDIYITVDQNIPRNLLRAKNQTTFKWEFVATRDGKVIDESKKKQDKPLFKLPQTGEEWRYFIYQICAGLLLLLIAILLIKHRRDRAKEENE